MSWAIDREPLSTTVDMNVNEEREVQLPDGSRAVVKLTGLHEECDELRGAVRRAAVHVFVNDDCIELVSGTYHLPVRVGGVQIDCPVTRGYTENSRRNQWALHHDARLRIWPHASPWVAPGSFVYPLRQKWFASQTQMANEPTYVDGPEPPGRTSIYYHEGLDFGGVEGTIETVAVDDALVVSLLGEVLPGHEETPAAAVRRDVVYLLDHRGWYHRHSHLQSVDPALELGGMVRQGKTVGVMGKEGHSGGWSHLHYGLSRLQPSGKWGAEEAYAYAWQAYVAEHSPALIAVARPHHLIWSGETAVLDGSRSWSADGMELSCEWTFSDGSTATGAFVEREYSEPGVYCETLKATDPTGRASYDFAVVQVANRRDPENGPAGIHAAHAPTFGIRPGDEVTFAVRSFGLPAQPEVWDFGDGSAPVQVQSDGNADVWSPDGYALTRHAYSAPGDYIASVRRTNAPGFESTARLHVRVEAD